MCVRSNGVRGDAERSFEFGSSDQRNKGAIHSQQWPVAGGVRLASGPGRGTVNRFLSRRGVHPPRPPLAV